MNGLPNLAPGLSASVFAGGYTNMSSKGTATWASPQGPQTATQAGWGTVAGGNGSTSRVTHGVLSAGAISLALLIFIWWSLPR
jgi:hypothetical protein